LTQVNAPELPTRQLVEYHLAFAPEPSVVTFTIRVIVPPGPTVTVGAPFKLTELTVRASVKTPVTETPEDVPTAVYV
jgi:hypothetical protein